MQKLVLGGHLRAKNTITIIRDVFYKREAWCNKKKATFKDSLKKENYLFNFNINCFIFTFILLIPGLTKNCGRRYT